MVDFCNVASVLILEIQIYFLNVMEIFKRTIDMTKYS